MGKMQIKRVTMATSHGSPPPGTCHTLRFSVENKYTYINTRAHHEPRGRWGWGKPKAKRQANLRQSKTMRAKVHSNGTTRHAHSEHLLANT